MKKLLGIGMLGVAMMLVGVGCGQSPEENAPADEEEESGETATVEQALSCSQGNVVYGQWCSGGKVFMRWCKYEKCGSNVRILSCWDERAGTTASGTC